MRKDLEASQMALEMESETLRKRHQATIAELQDQIEHLTRLKNKYVSSTDLKISMSMVASLPSGKCACGQQSHDAFWT